MIIEFAGKDIAKYLKEICSKSRIAEDHLCIKFEEYLCKRFD